MSDQDVIDLRNAERDLLAIREKLAGLAELLRAVEEAIRILQARG